MWWASPTPTRPRSPSAAPTRPACATSPNVPHGRGERGAADHPDHRAPQRTESSCPRPARWRRGFVVRRGTAWSRPRRSRRPASPPDGPARPPVLEVCTLRSVTSESAYVAHRLREAHLHHGLGVVAHGGDRSVAAAPPRRSAPGPDPGRRAHDHGGRGHRTRDPARGRPILLLLRCALNPSTLEEEAAVALLHRPLGGADPFTERQLSQGLRDIALAGGDKRPSGDLLVDALL